MARRSLLAALLALAVAALSSQPMAAVSLPTLKVALVVGPVGEELTPQYIQLAEMAAQTAESAGAQVARAYSPDATPERVLEAVEGANVVVYFGHGTGYPNPYSAVEDPEVLNGWGLQGPAARGTHDDSLQDGTLRYYGGAWLVEHARPAPGFVMIYSNACYAPGASEGSFPRPDEGEALAHVANYSAPAFAMGASAYFATDFYGGAAGLLERLLGGPPLSFGDVFRADPNFVADGLRVLPHPALEGVDVWLHRSVYFEGQLDYWYAFAGAPTAAIGTPPLGVLGSTGLATLGGDPNVIRGSASSYPFTPGFEDRPTVALPDALGGRATQSVSGLVTVCGDHCVRLPIVDSCPCHWGTPDQRVVNLSHAAWGLVTDMPLAEGLVPVVVYLDPANTGAGPAPPP